MAPKTMWTRYTQIFSGLLIITFLLFAMQRSSGGTAAQSVRSESLPSSARSARNFGSPLRFDKLTAADMAASKPGSGGSSGSASHHASPHKKDPLLCERWAVAMTVLEPTEAIKKMATLNHWCLLIVGDQGGPSSYVLNREFNNSVYLDVAKQQALAISFPFLQRIPWNHFGRKNFGYLYALLHGAKEVFDFDDDIVLITKRHHLAAIPNPESGSAPNMMEIQQPTAVYEGIVLNPYPLLGADAHSSWPRGFPIDRIKENSSSAAEPTPMVNSEVRTKSVAIFQFLANVDPDVDAIYRLTLPLPFSFPLRGVNPVLVPRRIFAPYNSQATLHSHQALWALFLPITVHGSVSDIWRGYAAQRLLHDIEGGGPLVFMSPIVAHYHNIHNHLADFSSEEPLYTRSLPLIELLSNWKSSLPTLPGRIEALWVFLFEHGFILEADVMMMQEWVGALMTMNYAFPAVQ